MGDLCVPGDFANVRCAQHPARVAGGVDLGTWGDAWSGGSLTGSVAGGGGSDG